MTTPKKKFYERYWMGHTNNEGFSLLFISVGHRNYIEFVWIVNDSIYVLFSIDFFFLAKNDAFSELCDCYSESVMYFCGDLNLEQVDIVIFLPDLCPN